MTSQSRGARWGTDARGSLWVAATIVLAVCAAYAPAFHAGFIWDDDTHLLNNPILEEGGLYRVWILGQVVIWYPVTFTSYWLEHRLFGLDPRVFHAVNILLHAACAVLFWRLLIALRIDARAALLAALLFALHPLNVESVAWVTQRKNTLSLLFFLVSILCFLRFDGAERSAARRGWYAGSFVAFVLGMLSKGAIAPLPFVLLLAVGWRRRDLAGAEGPWTRQRLLAAVPFLAVSIGLLVQHQIGQATWLGDDVVRDDSFWARLAGAGWIAWFYLGKTLLPTDLSFVYPRWEIDAASPFAWIPTSAALVALGSVLALWRRGGRFAPEARAVAFAMLYYALMIGSSLGFMNFYYLRYSYVADHYQYYAQLGLVALFAAGFVRLADSRRAGSTTAAERRGFSPLGSAAAIGAVTVLVTLGVLTHQRSRVYENDEVLWRDTLAKNPDASLALNNLAILLGGRGDHEEALALFLRATEVDPGNREAWVNAAVLFEASGDHARARHFLHEALLRWPGPKWLSEPEIRALSLADAHVMIARLAARASQDAVAEHHFQVAVHLDPANAPALVGIGDMLLSKGAVGPALARYQRATEVAPESAEAFERLARVRASHPAARVRDAARAVAFGERAVALTEGRDAQALDALAAAYAEAGRFEDAAATSRRAVALAEASGEADWVAELRARQRLYADGRAHRMTRLRLRDPLPR